MQLISFKHSQDSVILRVFLVDPNGAGQPGITWDQVGLSIQTVADSEDTVVGYSGGVGNDIEGITALGTYEAPTAGKCRFAYVNDLAMPGVYEIHLADARFAAAGAKSLMVLIRFVSIGLLDAVFTIPLTQTDPYDGVNGGLDTLTRYATMIQVADSGDYQFTAEALELGPTCTTYTLSTPGISVPECYAPDEYLDLVFGKNNIDKWADLDNEGDATTIANRRAWATCTASALIDSRFRDGTYVIPFVEPIELDIVDLCARWAGVLLYDGRLIREDQDQTDEMGHQRKIIEDRITKLLSGQMRLNLTRTSNAPSVVK